MKFQLNKFGLQFYCGKFVPEYRSIANINEAVQQLGYENGGTLVCGG